MFQEENVEAVLFDEIPMLAAGASTEVTLNITLPERIRPVKFTISTSNKGTFAVALETPPGELVAPMPMSADRFASEQGNLLLFLVLVLSPLADTLTHAQCQNRQADRHV